MNLHKYVKAYFPVRHSSYYTLAAFIKSADSPKSSPSSYSSLGMGPDSSKHHSDFSGFFSKRGDSNLRWQLSFGITVHSCFGVSFGTSFVAKRHTF